MTVEALAKIYLELAVLLPPEVESQREKTLKMRVKILEAAAAKVCWFDWSDNDEDAIASIDTLRSLLPQSAGATRKR